jgi:hypothetical protein
MSAANSSKALPVPEQVSTENLNKGPGNKRQKSKNLY